MDERIQVQHDDGYPEGFTLSDNRDIWDRCDRQRKFLFRPATAGVYLGMRSLPAGWEFRESWLVERLGLGRDALRRCIRELEEAARLSRRVVRDERGRYVRTVWMLHRAGIPSTGFPSTGNPATAKSTDGKAHGRQIRARINKEEASSTESITTTETSELVWPPKLSKELVVVARELIGRLDPQGQQQRLDELAGAMNKPKPPDDPIGWLRSIVEGPFTPNLCFKVAAERLRRAQEAVQREAARVAAAERGNRAQDPQERQRRQAISAAAAAELGL